MTDQARQDIRRLEPGSFHASTGREHISVLKQAIYEAADSAGILAVVALDADLVTYNLVREVILQRPAPPEPAATAAQHKTYEVAHKLHGTQSAALRATKLRIIEALEPAVIKIIDEGEHGIIRRSITDIITMLIAEYDTMTIKELAEYKTTWAAMRWDESTDLGDFISRYQTGLAFLTQHGNAPPVAEQVFTLQAAVSHVPVFFAMADAAFFHEAPLLANQDLATLITVYKRVYRGQYVTHATAAQHHLAANQATEETNTTASARINNDTGITAAQLAAITKAVVQAVQQIGIGKGQARAKDKAPFVKPIAIPPGACPLHPNMSTPHTWDQCSRNPSRK